MLLLDGLDEVPGERLRERVGRIVEHVINTGRSVGNRHLVTSRTRAYVGPVQLGDGIARFDLAEFGPEEVAEFVRRWSLSIHGLRPDGSGDPTELALAEEDQQRLAEAVAANPNVRPLTTSPLLLTMLAVLYRNEKRLPDQRAELYDVAIKYLLESRPGHSPYSAVQRRQAYEALALGMFVGQKKGPRRTIDRSQAAKWVAPFLVGSKAPDAQSIALAFLDDEEKSSGIIVSRTHGQVEFWHLTFQEYLAALGLSRASQHKKLLGARAKGGYWPILKPVLHDDRWAEVVLLLAGCLRHEGVDGASDLIRSIVDHDPSLTGRARAVGLTGRILRDIKPYGGSPEEGTGYAEALDEVLDLFKPGAKSTPESVRIEVGEALGASGDPRLADENANEVWIGGATFLMGAQARSRKRPRFDPDARDDECPTHFVTVSGFWIDRYPVTVGQYAHFVESGGYRNDPCWTPAGREWRDSRSRTDPDDWVGQLEHTNRPVVNVTWFEADAYAAWAGKRLPTESEWELAARGRNGRRFPWGDDRPAEHHASFDGRTSSPTPVGIYPRGATRWGVFDLAGNILEWCSDWYGTYPSKLVADPLGVSQGYARVTRGGAFYFDVLALRAACRRSYGPGFANDFLGFRCVRSSPGGHSEL